MPAIAGTVLCKSQEPRTQPRNPKWMARTQVLGPMTCCSLGHALAEAGPPEVQLGLESRPTATGC